MRVCLHFYYRFSSGAMTIKTYDYNGNKYADDFTITKTTDAQSADEVIAAADALVNSTDVAYTDESMEALKSALASLKELKASGTTADDPMVSDITTNYGTANDRVKGYGSIANDDDKDGAKIVSRREFLHFLTRQYIPR